MPDWIKYYVETDDVNERYKLLRSAIATLRKQRDAIEFFDPDAVCADVRRLNETASGELIVFAANDFGLPLAIRPSGTEREIQNEIRRAILQNKYDESNDDLNEIRIELLDKHPSVHKVIVAEYADGHIRYHLPEGSNDTTNFVTVREMVGLIDYTTNSFQWEDQCMTY